MCYKSHREYHGGFTCVKNLATDNTKSLNLLKILPQILRRL